MMTQESGRIPHLASWGQILIARERDLLSYLTGWGNIGLLPHLIGWGQILMTGESGRIPHLAS